jgi:hypothetical protein
MNRVPSLMGGCAASLFALVTCCSSSADPAAEQSEWPQVLEASQPGTCGGADLADLREAPECFRSCRADDDCVAVPVVGCCHNGWKTSVSRELEDAYALSFQCPTERPFCPKYLVIDTRVPECNQGTHLCELVATAHCAPASSR